MTAPPQDFVPTEARKVGSGPSLAAEASRLAAVERYDILDTPPDGAFDRITALAAKLFSVPIAIVSLVDHDRIWFKSHHGIDTDQISREPGLCASAIFQDGPWVLTDAKHDPRALANPLVAGEFGLRFYAGVPLRTTDGHNLGTLCVIDREPREVTEEQIEQLGDLAALVMDQMELRLSARRTVAQLSRVAADAERSNEALRDGERRFGVLAENLPSLCWMANAAGHIFWFNRRWYDYTGTTPEDQTGWGWESAHDPNVLPLVLKRWKASIASGEPFEMVFPLKGADGVFRPFLTRVVATRDEGGSIAGWIGTNTDVTELQALRLTQTLHHLVVESAADFAIITTDLESRITSWNAGACNLFGYQSEEIMGRSSDLIFTPEDRAEGRPATERRLALEQGRAVNERPHMRKDDTRFWASGLMMPLLDRELDRPVGLLIIVQDHTERRRHEEHMRLMVNELNHRVKNTLSTVQAIASQTLSSASSLTHARQDFTTRLIALAQAHDVLTRESWEGANLEDVATSAMEPFRVRGVDRLMVSGPNVRLSPKTALSLALAFHELCTNAAKYGALSNETGKVSIEWSLPDDGQFHLVWTERGGPPVTPPERKSFGSRLIRMALAAEPDGEVNMSFEPDGVVCTFRARFPNALPSGAIS